VAVPVACARQVHLRHHRRRPRRARARPPAASRLWPPGRRWGFPTGSANKGERHEDTIAREVREETGLTVKAGRLLKARSGFLYRIEIYYEAVLVGGLDGLTLDPKGVLEARLFSIGELPDGMPEAHRELAGSL
jgi:8-oxo-dGTP diphosphatase